MSEKKDETEWNFKVDGVKTKDENVERKKRKERLAEKLSHKEEKRDAQKDLMQQAKPKRMTVDGPVSSRKSRTRLAEEMARADKPEFFDLLASPVKRGISFAIDAGIFCGLMFLANSQWAKIEFYVLEFLRSNEMNQPLPPDTLKMTVMGSLAVLVYGLLMALPVCFSRQSWGKSFTKLSIHSADEDRTVTFIALFFREFIAKPISLATIVGPFLCLFNDERKGLHDIVSGTVVMDDSFDDEE